MAITEDDCQVQINMNSEDAKNLRHIILHDNEMLYYMYHRPYMETCMRWGLEIDNGWLNIVDEMSKSLEGLNYIDFSSVFYQEDTMLRIDRFISSMLSQHMCRDG